MPSQDTIELLRECVSGADMCISSLNEMIDKTEDEPLKKAMERCKNEHTEILNKAMNLLYTYGDHGKKTSAFAKSMAYMKTNITLAVDHSARSVSELVAKGCDMGIKSLINFKKEYAAADEESKKIADDLIHSERALAEQTTLYI